MNEPSPTADNGERDSTGRFKPGNKAAKGNPFARRVQALRGALIRAATPADIRDIMQSMIAGAKAGDTAAAKEVLSRLLGPPVSVDILERIARLESLLENQQ